MVQNYSISVNLLHLSEKHFTKLYPAEQSWQAVLNFSYISIKTKNQNKKFQPDNNIWPSPKAGWGNCMTVALCIALQMLSASQKYKNKDE